MSLPRGPKSRKEWGEYHPDQRPEPRPLQVAYVHVLGNEPGKRIGLVKFGESGYYPAKSGYDFVGYTEDQVRKRVGELNDQLDVPPAVAEAMFAGSMFGWHVPAAQAARTFFATPEPEPLPPAGENYELGN